MASSSLGNFYYGSVANENGKNNNNNNNDDDEDHVHTQRIIHHGYDEERVELVNTEDESNINDSTDSFRRMALGRFAVFWVVAMVLMVLLFGFHNSFESRGRDGHLSFITTPATSSSSSSSTLSAVVTNEYSYRNLKMFAYPWLEGCLLMEPWRESTVTVSGVTEGCSLSYTIVYMSTFNGGSSQYPSTTMSGTDEGTSVFFVTPTKTGPYQMKLVEICSGKESGKVLEQKVWVKYVRRELQSLNDHDREEFLDTYHKMWEITTRDGMVKYGDRFKSVYYFAMIHNDAGANHICDEFHEGTGFLNNHLQLGAYLEQSMRMINPRVSLHYLEYSKYFSSDAYIKHMKNNLDGGNWTEIMTAKYFGQNDPWTGAIIDGRWAYTPVPVVDAGFLEAETIGEDETFFPEELDLWLQRTGTHLTSPYGLLRSPWSFDPSRYTTRWNNVNQLDPEGVSEHAMKPFRGSTCSDYQIFLTQHAVGHGLQMYLETAEDSVHGYVHKTIGGFGGERAHAIDKILKEEYGLSQTVLFYVAQATHKFVKTYISMLDFDMEPIGYITPLLCSQIPFQNGKLMSTAMPGEEGGPICECNSYYLETEERVDSLIAIYFNHFMADDDSLFSFDFETKKEIMQLICSRMSFEGDMAGSGAATDPLFWVAHGAVERLFQRVVFDNVLLNLEYVSSVRGTCSGHSADGKKAWLKGLYLEDESIDMAQLTNTQLNAILDPRGDLYRDLVNFVYEDSDWPWCDGFDAWLNPATAEDLTKIVPPTVENAPGPSNHSSGRVVPTAPSLDNVILGKEGAATNGGTGAVPATVPPGTGTGVAASKAAATGAGTGTGVTAAAAKTTSTTTTTMTSSAPSTTTKTSTTSTPKASTTGTSTTGTTKAITISTV